MKRKLEKECKKLFLEAEDGKEMLASLKMIGPIIAAITDVIDPTPQFTLSSAIAALELLAKAFRNDSKEVSDCADMLLKHSAISTTTRIVKRRF